MLNYLKGNCLITHFPIKATDTTNNQTSCFLSVVLSAGGDAKTNTAALFNTKSACARRLCGKKHTVHCLQNADMDLSRKTGSKYHYDTIARSAFWRTAKLISSEIVGFPPDEANWYERIAWANLFPRSAERRRKSIRSFDFSTKTDCQEITEPNHRRLQTNAYPFCNRMG